MLFSEGTPLETLVTDEIILNKSFISGNMDSAAATRQAKTLQKNQVSRFDWPRISQYAAANESELFAELGTAIDLGMTVPSNLRRVFFDTVGRF